MERPLRLSRCLQAAPPTAGCYCKSWWANAERFSFPSDLAYGSLQQAGPSNASNRGRVGWTAAFSLGASRRRNALTRCRSVGWPADCICGGVNQQLGQQAAEFIRNSLIVVRAVSRSGNFCPVLRFAGARVADRTRNYKAENAATMTNESSYLTTALV